MAKYIVKPTKKYSARQVGQKAANLAFLIRRGYRVPRTAFVPVRVFNELLAKNGLQADRARLDSKPSSEGWSADDLKTIREKIEGMDLPTPFQKELSHLLQQWRHLGISKLAIRSSAVSEDLGEKSFAGQYFTALHVPAEPRAVMEAIKKVWASFFFERVRSYAQGVSPNSAQGMGVVLQEMVDARFAGVVFSRDPLAIDREELLVEYVEGNGQQLVDGEALPKRLRLSRESILAATSDLAELKDTLPGFAAFLQALLSLESLVDSAIDVEWAFDGKAFYFLQFRPITSLKNVIIWSDENVGEVIPDVVTPFSWSILEPMTNGAYRYFLHRLGLRMPKEPLFALYEGKVYFNRNAFRRVLNAFYVSHYLGPGGKIDLATLPRLMKPAYFFVRLGLFLLRLPYKIWPWNRPISDKLIGDFQRQTPEQHVKEIKRLLRWSGRIMNFHVSVTIFAELYYQALDKICQSWCDGLNIEAGRLLQAIGEVESTQPARVLWEIGQWIRKNERYREKFTNLTIRELQAWLDTLPVHDPLRKAIDLFFDYYGHGALHEFELIYPRWKEEPGYILQSLRNYARERQSGFDLHAQLRTLEKERTALREQALTHLRKQARWRVRLFSYLLKKAEYFSLERELLKQQIVRLFFGIKQHLVAMSRAFFDDEQAIFYLTWPEVQRLAKGRLTDKELTLKIQQRRLLRNKQMEMVHPARLMQKGEHWIPLTETAPSEKQLQGIPCSPGLVEGRVRVVLKIEESARFEQGEILVTKATNPGWTPLMVMAGGIITEIGGALSHGAIIAREFGIPMIAAVAGITERLKSGQWVRLNGQTGTIEILEED